MAEKSTNTDQIHSRAELGSYKDQYIDILRQEGITIPELKINPLFSTEHTKAAEHLFGMIFSDPRDPRWLIVETYLNNERELNTFGNNKPRAVHREASMQAVYLTSDEDHESGRNRYARIDSDFNIRHFARAETNLKMYPNLQNAFEGSSGMLLPSDIAKNGQIRGMPEQDAQECYELNFLNDSLPVGIVLHRTKGVKEDHNPDMQPYNITACPEALYQLVMFGDAAKVHAWGTDSKRNRGKVNKEGLREGPKPKGATYISRVGFNVHHEGDHLVISVTNIQNNNKLFPNFVHKFANKLAAVNGSDSTNGNGIKNEPIVLLLERVQQLAQVLEEHTGTKVEVRGLANPRPKTLEGNEEALQRLQSKYTKSLEAVGIKPINRKWRRGAIAEDAATVSVDASSKVQQVAQTSPIESPPEYIQIASVIYPEADVNNLTSEQRDILHKIMTAGTEIMEQNPGISEDKLVEMINERVHIPGYRQPQPAAAENKSPEKEVEQKAEPAAVQNERIVIDEYYSRFLNGEFPQYGELAVQIFHGADVNKLSPEQQQTLTSILDAAIMVRKQNPSDTEEELQQKVSVVMSDILKPNNNVNNVTIEKENVPEDKLHVTSPSVIVQNPETAPETRRVNKIVENKRALQRMRINRLISEQLAEDAWNVTPKAVAFQHNGQVFRNGENQVAVIPLDKNAAYAVVPDSAYRVQIEGWQDPNVVAAKLADTFPGNTSPRMWKLRSDYTGDEWKPKKKPEKPPVIMPSSKPDDSDSADVPPPPPVKPNMQPNVPGYSAPNFQGGPPLINPNRANSGQRNRKGSKGKNQAGEVAKTAAVLTGQAALITGKFAGKVAVKATVATAKGVGKVATSEKTWRIAGKVALTTAKVAATIAFSPVIMYVASRDEKTTEDGVERVHSPGYYRWRKAGKMAGRAFHETGLAYMKFGAVGGEMFGDHETNEFVDKLYLKKSREWEAEDQRTRQMKEEESHVSWNPVNWLGSALNAVNPSVDDIQRGHAEAQAAWGKERRENAYERLEHEYGPKEAKRIMADLENQGLDPNDIEKAAKQKVNDTRDAEQTEKTWRKIEKQHGKAVADALRVSGADLTDMGLIHAADDIADRQRKEQAAADAAEQEAKNKEKAENKVRKMLGPDAEKFIDKHKGDSANWLIEQAEKKYWKDKHDAQEAADYEIWRQKQEEERQRKADEKERKQREKLEREEEERIKAERRKQKEDAERAAQNAESPPRQQPKQPQQQPQSQPAPQPQPPTFVPPQPESRPAKQPDPAPQKPDQKPTQTRSSSDAKQGGGSFQRIRHDDNAQEERPEKQDTKPQQPQKPSLPTAVRTPQPKTQQAPEQAPLPPPQPPVSESKPQPPSVNQPEQQAEEPTPPRVTVPVYQYLPPPRKEVEPQKPPEPKVPEQKMQEQPPEPEPQKPEPPPEVAPQQSSAQPDAPSSEEPEVLPGIHQSYTAEENTREPVSGNDLADLYDRVRSIGEDVTETPEAQHEIARSKLQEIEDALNSGNFETDDDKNNAAIIKKAIDKTKELFDKK